MINLIDLIILALASFRLAKLFVDEQGLFNIFERIRNFFGVNFDYPTGIVDPQFEHSAKPSGQPNQIAAILSCVYCCSLWIGIFLVIPYYFAPTPVIWFSLPFALSGAAILIYHQT